MDIQECDEGMGGQDDQEWLIKPEHDDNVGDCHTEEDMQGTEQEDGPHTDVDDTVEAAATAESVDTAQQNALLKEIEEQCVSHGRHPGEWDNVQLTWLQPMAPSVPYFCVSKRLVKPLRPREVICELLAAGLPVHPTAHTDVQLPASADRFVKASKRLVATARGTALELNAHVAVAVQQGILQQSCTAFVADATQALQSAQLAQSAEALATVVRYLLLMSHFNGFRTCFVA